MNRPAPALRALAGRAVRWSALTTAGRFVLQLVAQVLLARLLGPDNYGVYGIGLVVLTFAAFLSGNAFSYGLLLQERISDADIRFAFTWQLLAGLVCSAALWALAGPLAGFFGDAQVLPMVRWMAAACLLLALAGPSTCLLQRELDFRALGLVQLASYAAGYLGVGLALALAGHGPQALAAACVTQAAVALVGCYLARPHPLRLQLRPPVTSAASWETGRTVWATNVLNWMLSNLDRLLIGRLLNAQAVGLFSVAYNIASIPNVLLVGALQPTFLAAGARLQEDLPALAQAWMTLLACILVVLVPVALAMALLAGELVRVLYGPAWADAGWVMAVLFLCVPAFACWGLSTPVLWNTGRKHLEVRLQLPVLALALPAWWLAAPAGIRAVALVSAAVVTARAALIVGAGLRALQLRPARLLPLAWRGLLLAALCGTAVTAGRELGRGLPLQAAPLLLGALLAALAGLLAVAAWPTLLGPDALRGLRSLRPAAAPRWATEPRT